MAFGDFVLIIERYMSDLKNPFGLRDGILFMIEDMSPEERGKKCNCVCPSCEGHFIARLKDEHRRKHFAHDGEACDEVKAYLDGLYALLREYLAEGRALILPPLGIAFPLEAEVTEERIHFLEEYDPNRLAHIELTAGLSMTFDRVEIVRDARGYPEAIVTNRGRHTLAVVIKPPDTVCKDFYVKRYRSFSTVSVSFDDADAIQTSTKQALFLSLSENRVPVKWVYNASWKTKRDEIKKRREIYRDKKERERLEQEKMEQERKERERLNKERLEKESQEKERLEKERLERERLEKERLEKERREQRQAEWEAQKQRILENRRLKEERKDKERLEKEHLEEVRRQQEKLEKAYLDRENQLKPEYVSNESHRQIDTRLPSISIFEMCAQQDVRAIDRNGRRWKKCETCQRTRPVDPYFTDYESSRGQNLGLCKECAEKNNQA